MLKKKIIFLLIILIIIFGCIGFLSFKVYNKIKKKNDQLNYLFNTLSYIKIEIEKTHLEGGYIKTKLNEKLLFKKKSLRKLLGYNSDNYERPFGYIDFFKDRLIFVSGKGSIYISNDFNGNLDDLNFNLINTNLKNEFDSIENFTYKRNFIRDILVDNDKLYLNIVDMNMVDDIMQYSPKIIVAKITESEENLFFENFFTSNEYEIHGSADLTHGGGRIINYKDNFLLYSVPEFGSAAEKAQDKKSIFGKMILINKESQDYKMFSMGHRNPQGLVWDPKEDVILSSEHGPIGGDEVNIIKEGKNYGWPIATIGHILVDGSPPKKDPHDNPNYDFEKPADNFGNYNCGPSEIVKLPANFLNQKENNFLLSCLSGADPQYGLSLYHYILENNKLVRNQKIYINDRIRDLAVFNNKILVLGLEEEHSLGIIYNENIEID